MFARIPPGHAELAELLGAAEDGLFGWVLTEIQVSLHLAGEVLHYVVTVYVTAGLSGRIMFEREVLLNLERVRDGAKRGEGEEKGVLSRDVKYIIDRNDVSLPEAEESSDVSSPRSLAHFIQQGLEDLHS